MLKDLIAALLFVGLSAQALADDLLVPSQYPTIQAAIDAAVDGDQIVIAAGTYRELLDGQNKSLTYTGAGMGQTILSGDLDDDGTADGDVLSVNDNTATEFPSIAMADLTISDAVNGVYVYRLHQGSFVRCEVTGTTSEGIYARFLASTMLIDGCDFHSNNISIQAYGASGTGGLVITNSTMRDSERAAYLDYLTVVIRDSEISGHSERAVYLDDGDLSIYNCGVRSNLAGGIETSRTDVRIFDSFFTDNIADGTLDQDQKYGAAIYSRFGSVGLSVQRTVFRRNASKSSGGAVSANANNCIISDCLFEENTCGLDPMPGSGLGAAVDVWSTTTTTIENCDFIQNSGDGTGPLNMGAGSLGGRVVGCNFIDNGRLLDPDSDGCFGGGLCVESGMVTIEDCLFKGNRASGAGAIMNLRGMVLVEKCLFYVNIAQNGDAGAIAGWPFDAISSSIFVGNKAVNGIGGAISGDVVGRSPNIDSCVFYNNTADYGSILGTTRSEAFITNSIALVDNKFNNFVQIGARIDNPNLSLPVSATNIVTTNHESIGFTRLPNHGGDGWGDDPATPGIDEGANDDFGDLRLTAHSPAIDAGSNADIPIDTYDIDQDGDNTEPITGGFDMDGNPRFVDTAGMPNVYPANDLGGPIDLGAYEFQGQSCHADVNGDGALTPTDFTAWIDAFNSNAPPADQNRDGSITPTDFTAWINNFNAGC